MKTSRRDFVRGAGGVLAGVVLAHCGGGDDSPSNSTPLPNGYRFYRLFTTGDPLPGASGAAHLPPSVKINDKNQILFHAVDAENNDDPIVGLYELLMDYGGSKPTVQATTKVVRMGDTLPDGKEVLRVSLADVNNGGSVAVRVLNKGEVGESLYLERSRSGGSSAAGLERVLGFNTPTPDGQDLFGGWLGNFDLHDGDQLLVAAGWGSRTGAVGGQSVFQLPDATVSSKASILMSAGDQLPDGSHVINKIGLLQGHTASGVFTVQAQTEVPAQSASPAGSAVLKGATSGPQPQLSVIAASAGVLASAKVPTGHVYYGPRVNSAGEVGLVTHVTDDDVQLTVGNSTIAKTGDSTPTGKIISGLGGPVMGEDGLVFFVTGNTDESQELLVSNGSKLTSVISTGMKLFGSKGPALVSIGHGYAREQADSAGRIVFVGEFDDNTLSVVLGIPV